MFNRLLTLTVLSVLAVAPARADDHADDGPFDKEVVSEDGSGPKEMRYRRRGEGGEGGGRMGEGRKGKRGGLGDERKMDPAMKERFEKMRAAQEKVRDLTKKLRQAKDSEKPAIKKEARAALSELFDARLTMEQSMVDKMSEHLAEKKEKLAKKKAAKDKLVDEKLDKLAGDAPSWDD